MECK